MPKFANVMQLGFKELRALLRDPAMMTLIAYAFTLSIYASATGVPETPHRAAIAVVDEDRSAASQRILDALQEPYFLEPQLTGHDEMDEGMDDGRYTFTLDIPPNFQRDLLDGNKVTLQLNVDATQISQAFTGAGYLQQIINSEVASFLYGPEETGTPLVQAVVRIAYNPNLTASWFGAVNDVINHVTMLSIILTGAALIREREHGTIEHLLVTPVTPFEIMLAKVWSMGLVVLVAATLALRLVVNIWLEVPLAGSFILFLFGAMLHLFATTSMGIFFGTVARSMPQLGLLIILTLIPLQMLSGGTTPRESMPELIQNIMLAAPTTHFVMLGQSILFRGAGLSVVWPQLMMLAVIGTLFFGVALSRLRKSLA
ncbi:ABC transporter permease [Halomonas sp. HP20-15]|uniref:ABC transporter permease n=1 Tax=Halomonas sp. HP20-15 TaxID=3085901 RepID=UPI00298117CD|nr:ABC transporter permease [Halomonas sp. HP20-15]MDW5377932.1 ABC transporter permease [Halomonas sp. HP20-15]